MQLFVRISDFPSYFANDDILRNLLNYKRRDVGPSRRCDIGMALLT